MSSSSYSKQEKSKFFKIFPMPKLLQIPAVGIDISDTTIKFVELTQDRNGVRLTSFADKKIESGIVESGEIKKPKELAKALKEIKRKFDITSAHASLPEERAYLFEEYYEKPPEQSLRDVIEFHLEESVPIPVTEAVFDFDVIKVLSDGRIKVSVSVMPKEVVEKYSETFGRAEIWLESLEIEAQSIARSIIPEGADDAHMVVDFGRTRTGVAIVSRGIVRFTSTIETGGDSLTKIIQEEFGLKNSKDAESMKEKKGLYQGKNSIDEKLIKDIDKLRSGLQKHIDFWETHSRGAHTVIEKIVLTGGNASVPGVKNYLSQKLGKEVCIPNVWQNIFDINETLPKISKGDSLSFATAIGLALKTIKN